MIRYTRSLFTHAFRANFYVSSPRKKIVMGKKDSCAVFGRSNDHLFPEKYTVKFFTRKAHINTERVPPGHPIIFLKSSKFNMAAVSVKRPIDQHLLKRKVHINFLKLLKRTGKYGKYAR